MEEGPIIIISAPSGAGKTTLVRALVKRMPNLQFSVSATTRTPRANERDGVDYHFLTVPQFQDHIKHGDFIEWEEVYTGRYYGTLLSEADRILAQGRVPLFEVDAVGGVNLKQKYGARAHSIFVKPPSKEVLRERLIQRGTDDAPEIARRMQKADFELGLAPQFDTVILNDDLHRAVETIEQTIQHFVGKALS